MLVCFLVWNVVLLGHGDYTGQPVMEEAGQPLAQARLCLLRPPGVQATVVSEAQCSACGVGEVPTAIRDHLLRVVTVPGLQEEARGLSLYEAQFPLTAGPSAALGSLAGGLSGLCWSLCHSPRVACLDLQVLLSLLWDMPLASAPSGAW